MQRRAAMVGGGNGNSGRCTGEIVVDGAADLQIQGDTATVRDISGRQPQIQRFECTSAIPPRANIRVNVNGRGNSRLTSSPANGGPAVIHIEDSEGGASPYQFELTWNNGPNQGDNQLHQQQGNANQGYPNQGYDQQRYDQRYPDTTDRRQSERPMGYGRFGPQQAVNVCRDAIRQQAMDRFGTQDVNFGRINMDDNPGRRDWVVGTIDVRRGWRDEQHSFSCSVDFDSGRVRSARIEAPNQGYAGRDIEARQMDTCRGAVRDKIGSNRVDIRQMHVDPDGDMVRGSAFARDRAFSFTCRVDPQSGSVRDVNVWRQ